VEWLDLRKSVAIPDFYDVQEIIAKAEAHYTSQDFGIVLKMISRN